MQRLPINLAGQPTLLRKAVQPEALRRPAYSAGLEVDDLSPQFFRYPLFFGLKICWNVKFNQFRHHVLLTGYPTPSCSVLKEPPQTSKVSQAHISLSFYIFVSSKLNAIYRNTDAQREFFAELREKAQVSLSNVRFGAKEFASFVPALVRPWTLAPRTGQLRYRRNRFTKHASSIKLNFHTNSTNKE